MEQDLLRIDTVAHADRVTVSLRGELDVSTSPDLVDALASVVQGRAPRLDVDLERLDYADSTGLSVFVTAHFQCLDAGIPLRFTNPNQFVLELLAVTGLDDVLSVAVFDSGSLVGA